MPTEVPYTGVPGGSLYEREESIHDNPIPSVRIETPPAAFGTNIAEATQHLGQVNEDAGKELFDRAYAMQELKVHADVNTRLAATNNAANDKLVQFKQLEGKAAVDALPTLQQDLDKIRSDGGQGLSPYGQQLYDSESRNIRGRMNMAAGSHAAEQSKVYEVGSANATITSAMRDMSLDPSATGLNIAKINSAVDHKSDIQGLPAGDPQRDMARRQAVDTAYQVQIHAMAREDPIAATKVYNAAIKSGALFSPDAMTLDATLKNLVADKSGREAAVGAHTSLPTSEAPGATVATPAGLETYKARVAQIESASGRNEGQLGSYYQFEPGTWAKYGAGGTRGTAAGEDTAINALTNDNRNALKAQLGREPTQAELYLAHQQGAQGALKLMDQPSRRAGDIVGDKAINGNGGNSNMTAGEFIAMWTAKFDKTPVPPGGAVPPSSSGSTTTAYTPTEEAADRPLADKTADALTRLHTTLDAAGIPVTPEAEQKTIAHVEALDAQTRRITEDTNKRDLQTISGAIYGGGNNQKLPSTLGELRQTSPEVGQAVDRLIHNDPEKIFQVTKELNKNAKGDVPETPERLGKYSNLKGMATTDPEGFAKQNILSADLPMAWKKELVDLQAKGAGKAPAEPSVAAAFKQPGIANQIEALYKPKTDDYNLLAAEVGDEMQQFVVDNKRQPNAAEREEIVTRLLQDKTVAGGGWFGLANSTEKAFRVQPPADWMQSTRTQVQAQRGYVPTDMELTRAWNAYQYQKEYGGGAGKSSGTDNSAALKKAGEIPTHIPNWGPKHAGGSPSGPIIEEK